MSESIIAHFADRPAAELAVEHLVQQYGVERTDVFVQPVSDQNSAGSSAAGADTPNGDAASQVDAVPALGGAIEVSVDLNDGSEDDVRKALTDAGGEIITA
jgi:NACalpha-BTF3-like transcription factor